jgi:carotenoid cleavage dioxygenase-like enzyme
MREIIVLCLVAAASAGLTDDVAQAWLSQARHYLNDGESVTPEPSDEEPAKAQVGYFLRDMQQLCNGSASAGLPEWLSGMKVYRSVPSKWPKGMDYHYDGLASPMRFDFANGSISWKQAAYQSGAWKNYDNCLWLGAGSLHLGPKPCLTNPGVNILPLDGQLWMTIDNRFWGAIDMETLDTPAPLGIPALVEVYTVALNAHPACDYNGNGECLVTYPCAGNSILGLEQTFNTDHLCVGVLEPRTGKRKVDMSVRELSRAKLPSNKFIAHSHQPSITKNFLVNKIDNFVLSKKDPKDAGMLKYMHQNEDNLWMVMDRRTNQSRILESDFHFVNNHFVNLFEEGEYIVVDTMPGTQNYLENYFRHNLANATWMTSRWSEIMMLPQRCHVPMTGNETIKCERLLQPDERVAPVGMDFPTFNPNYKYNADSKWWWVTTPAANNSMWFDTVAKIDAKERKVVSVYNEPGVYVMEVNFLPRPGATEEDDGLLFSIFYDSNVDSSFIALIDPVTMKLQYKVDMGVVIPYHSHGVLCKSDGKCFANP